MQVAYPRSQEPSSLQASPAIAGFRMPTMSLTSEVSYRFTSLGALSYCTSLQIRTSSWRHVGGRGRTNDAEVGSSLCAS